MKRVTKPWQLLILGCGLGVGCAGPGDDVSQASQNETVDSALQQVRSANPFVGSVAYVNPDYAKNTALSANQLPAGSADRKLVAQVGNQPTAVWLDRIAAIAGGTSNDGRLGLTGHLDAALVQAKAAGKPATVLLVVYDLPDRDCAAAASNGELQGVAGLATYKAKYIDAIAGLLQSKAAYKDLRIAVVLEPDSIPNLVTNTGLGSCQEAVNQGLYWQGVSYAISKLSTLSNVYLYLDIGHSGWLGWPSNLGPAVTLYHKLVSEAGKGDLSVIRGFVTNTANYTPVREPFVSPNDNAVLNGPFYQSNPIFDELTYVQQLGTLFENAGFKDFGFLIDTARNGWKPVNDGKPIDRRKARGNWCNVGGTGIGERPRATPVANTPRLDAFVWVKPPGESDGMSAPENPGNTPDAEGKRFDLHCNPNDPTLDAMAGAPSAGHWFNAAFMAMLHNATPPLTGDSTPAPTPAPAPAPNPNSTPAPAPAPTPTPAPAPNPNSAPAPTPAPNPNSPPGPAPGATTCTVTTQVQPPWQNGGSYQAVVQLDVKNTGTTPVPVPWTLTVSGPGYSGVQNPWNWTAQISSNNQVQGTASADWQNLQAFGANSVNVGAVLISSTQDLRPTAAQLNGHACMMLSR